MTTTITVKGMTCEGCEELVEGALEEVSGAESADADRESETATIEGDADVDELVEAVDFAGYEGSAEA
jgi:copper chaperone CopZ